MSGVRKRVRQMARSAVEHHGSLTNQRRASTGDGVAACSAQAGALSLLTTQRRGSFSGVQPLPLPMLGGGGGSLPDRGSSVVGDELRCGHDAPISSGDDTTGPLVSRLHSYSKLRPSGSDAAAPRPRTTGGSGSIYSAQATSAPLWPPSPSGGGSKGMASELAVLAGLRQASQGSLGRGGMMGTASSGEKPPPPPLPNLPTTNEGSLFAFSVRNSYQSMAGSARPSHAGSVPPPRPHLQNMDAALSRLSGENLTTWLLHPVIY